MTMMVSKPQSVPPLLIKFDQTRSAPNIPIYLEMLDSTKLIDQLSRSWEISEENQNTLLTKSTIQREHLTASGHPSAVGISSVSTFIAKKSFHNFTVPPFAAHWGIVCDFSPQTRFLYHLVFEVGTREVAFRATSWTSKWNNHQVTPVGTTPYGAVEIYEIGNKI
jgi:hypothetical protein